MTDPAIDSIRPVILCGGSGTRLWPVSRESYPKQFAALLGPGSLFQDCVERMRGEGFGKPVIVTAAAFRFVAQEQIARTGVRDFDLLIEPERRDTGPAVLAAALFLAAQDPEALMVVAPSDHRIADAAAFRSAVRAGVGGGAGRGGSCSSGCRRTGSRRATATSASRATRLRAAARGTWRGSSRSPTRSARGR